MAGSVLTEAHDEWQVADKRYLSEATLALLNPTHDTDDQSVAAPAERLEPIVDSELVDMSRERPQPMRPPVQHVTDEAALHLAAQVAREQLAIKL